jgi:GntR family transcriptional regulator/MocR family aminotransferase
MILFDTAKLKQDIAIPLYQQIYEHLRLAILNGQLKRGAQIPSTRALADELGVSRNTILNAYDQLAAEGYLERLEGKGTFVTQVLPDAHFTPRQPLSRERTPRVHRLSDRAADLMTAPTMPINPTPSRSYITFAAGMPALDAFPFELWAKLVSRHAHSLHPGAMVYQAPAGYRPLREAIADHIIVARQVHCSPEQVIIVTGSQGALHLAARVLLNMGDKVWVEEPGYLGAKTALVAAGAQIVPVPVDEEGLKVEEGIARAPDARLAYVTPSHQFPLGMTLSLKRRLALLDWARDANAYILEDDYDGEYRFDGRPIASLQGLDNADSVIYIGTFSKVLFPALRLGYLIVPPSLVDAFLTMRRSIDVNLPHLEQAVLAEFIREGHFTRHIRRMRTLYAERRTALIELANDLPLELYAPHTGMHLVGWLPPHLNDQAIADEAHQQQVGVLPVSLMALEAMQRGGLIIGYASVNEAEMKEGVRRLATVLRNAHG